MKKVLKYFLVFVFLFLMNIFIFKILATLGFQLIMSEKSYIVLPLFSLIVLYMIDKELGRKRNLCNQLKEYYYG
ncbi:putative membrane protein [Streptococcus pneumoniae 2070335]|nr:putative membrane protein [Streptococcus pneumoniae 2070335]